MSQKGQRKEDEEGKKKELNQDKNTPHKCQIQNNTCLYIYIYKQCNEIQTNYIYLIIYSFILSYK